MNYHPRLVQPRILCFDGDGVKAVVQIKLLEKISEHTGLRVRLFFDLSNNLSYGLTPNCLGRQPV